MGLGRTRADFIAALQEFWSRNLYWDYFEYRMT